MKQTIILCSIIRKAPGVKGTRGLTRAREGIRTPNLLIRSLQTRLPKYIYNFLVFSPTAPLTSKSFLGAPGKVADITAKQVESYFSHKYPRRNLFNAQQFSVAEC